MQAKVKNDTTVFYPSKTNMVIIAVVIMFFTVAIGIMARSMQAIGEMSWFFGIYFVFLGIGIWSMVMIYFQSRIEFREHGMLYVRGGSHLFIPYDEMARFHVRSSGKNKSIGIKLTHKIKPDTRGIADRIFFGWATDYVNLLPYTRMPTQGFFRPKVDVEKLIRTEFGKVLHEYVPHLFDTWDKQK